MATQGKANKQSKSVGAGQEVPVETPAEVTRADAPAGEAAAMEPPAPIAAEPPPAEAVAAQPPVEAIAPAAKPEMNDIVAAPVVVIEKAADFTTESFASFEFDAALWSRKSVEFWAENAAAFLGLAERIAAARSLEEVVDLQSRFASARFEAFVRQSQELMDFAKGMAALSAAPLCASYKQAA